MKRKILWALTDSGHLLQIQFYCNSIFNIYSSNSNFNLQNYNAKFADGKRRNIFCVLPPTDANIEKASCKCAWNGNVHFSRGPRSKLCTHCIGTVIGPGPTGWVGPTSPVPGLTAGRPCWGGAGPGTRPNRAHGRTAVHHAGRSDAERPGHAFPCGKARRFRSVGGLSRLQ